MAEESVSAIVSDENAEKMAFVEVEVMEFWRKAFSSFRASILRRIRTSNCNFTMRLAYVRSV